MTARFVVKRRRTIRGAEGTTVISRPLSKEDAQARLDVLNELHQTPGNYYIEEWRDAS